MDLWLSDILPSHKKLSPGIWATLFSVKSTCRQNSGNLLIASIYSRKLNEVQIFLTINLCTLKTAAGVLQNCNSRVIDADLYLASVEILE